MGLLEQIQKKLQELPPEKQNEILDFVTFLQQRVSVTPPAGKRASLQKHPAFGSWKERRVDALQYQDA